MDNRNKEILSKLREMHPDAQCELNYGSVFELLVAVILSARCTDKRVNIVTQELFKRAKTATEIANLPITELERLIFSCGFYKSKAKNIQEMAKRVVELGEIPKTLKDLVKLPGVGIKTANVVISTAYQEPAIAVDTHVHRVSNRLGIVHTSKVEDTQRGLEKSFDKQDWSELHHLLIFQGRYICKSQNPNCEECKLNNICEYRNKQ